MVASTADEIDKVQRSGRFFVAAPRHVLIRSHQHEVAPIKVTRLRYLHIQNRKRHIPACSRFDQARDGSRWVEAKKGVIRTKRIVKRAPAFQPQMRRTTSRNHGGSKRTHSVFRLSCTC